MPPEHLRFHIRQAVQIARAKRIGHGVALSYEDDALGLLADMRQRGVLVEICLTSNDVILGVKDAMHPFPDYWQAGVLVTLATDDEGVSRIDLSHEYWRAATTYGLGYRDLKTLARNSLTYSFLPGVSLWHSLTPLRVVDACANDRVRLQWRLEQEFVAFEGLPWLQ